MDIETPRFNRLILHPDFNETVSTISKLNIKMPPPTSEGIDFNSYAYPKEGKLISVEKEQVHKLDPKIGEKLSQELPIYAYDESFNKFVSLEGTAFLTAHALIVHGKTDYIPSIFLTFYFYTRSNDYVKKSRYIKYSQAPEEDFKRDYVQDRSTLLINSVNLPENPSDSLIFIDGPLIGGQISGYTIKLNEELLNKNEIPIFFVKNSNSNLVTDNVKELAGKYNSDLHWAFSNLKEGERTNFFKYVDQTNPHNAKVFCYLKAFNRSPQRIEFHIDTYEKYGEKMADLMNLIYYLLLVQGDLSNPQIRSIAIAEKYAREAIKLINFNRLMRQLGIVPTMNQERFGVG